jgi:hypothetical protein
MVVAKSPTGAVHLELAKPPNDAALSALLASVFLEGESD